MSSPLLSIGSRGPQVADLQRQLAKAGFSPGQADGDFGPKTQAAVVDYQKARQLAADGVVGPMTQAALARDSFRPSNSEPSSRVSTVRQGSKGPQVQALQQKLQAAGLDPGPVDGDFGPQTKKAVVQYQKLHGQDPNGVVGQQTWASLNGDTYHPGPASPAPGQTQGPAATGDLPRTG